MAVDIPSTLSRGGRELVDFLEYCVLCQKLDPMFAFLAGEYRLRPTALGAIALYDVFCAPGAQGRVSVTAFLPPRRLALKQHVEQHRAGLLAAEDAAAAPPPEGDDDSVPRPLPAPGNYLFDELVAEVKRGQQYREVSTSFDPTRTPRENLPGGTLSAGQRSFVEFVWQPGLRPYLVSAGFRRIANIA